MVKWKEYDIYFSPYRMNKYGQPTKSKSFWIDGSMSYVALRKGKPYKLSKIANAKYMSEKDIIKEIKRRLVK